jgi:hypothetical protein
VKKNNFVSIFSSRRVNYIFHKLSVNTKHVQFRLCMSPWRIFVEMGTKLIFPVFSEELLHAAMWLKLPKGCVGTRILIFFALDPKLVPKTGNLRFGNSKIRETG